VVTVSNGSDGRVTFFVELAQFAGRHLDEGVSSFTGLENGLLSGRAGNLTT
jgi:hypothetical protein